MRTFGSPLTAAILAAATVLFHHGNIAFASDASLKPYNGIWASSPAQCRRVSRHISNSKHLDDLMNFVSQDEGAVFLVGSSSIRYFDEVSTLCRLVRIDRPSTPTTATMTCFNAVSPDVSTDVLEIARTQLRLRQERFHRCISMSELSEKMARLWTFDSKKCSANALHSQATVTISKDLAENLTITVTGKAASDLKSDFVANIFVDQFQPIEMKAAAIPGGFSLPLGLLALRASMISDGLLMEIWTKEMASAGTGVFKMPVLELPLLGGGRAMDFLRQCQPASDVARATTDQERVREFIKSFIAESDRNLPDYKHKEPPYRAVDLNGDGRSDIILVGNSPAYCGTAGCIMFVYLAQPDGRFLAVYEKQSQIDDFPIIGTAESGFRTLTFPYAQLSDRVVHEVAIWKADSFSYVQSHYLDGDIKITPADARRVATLKTDGVVRDRPATDAKQIDETGSHFTILGTVENSAGRWAVAKQCNGCRYGYAQIIP